MADQRPLEARRGLVELARTRLGPDSAAHVVDVEEAMRLVLSRQRESARACAAAGIDTVAGLPPAGGEVPPAVLLALARVADAEDRLLVLGWTRLDVVDAERPVTRRRLLAGVDPAVQRPLLGLALAQLAFFLFTRDRAPEALGGAGEAVGILEDLVPGDPSRYRPAGVVALDALSRALVRAERTEEALPRVRQAADLCRTLAGEDPACRAYLDLILALRVNVAAKLKRWEEAKAAANERLQVTDVVGAADAMEREAHQRARALLDRTHVTRADVGAAIEASREAVRARRDLVHTREPVSHFNLARALQLLGSVFLMTGSGRDGIECLCEAYHWLGGLGGADVDQLRGRLRAELREARGEYPNIPITVDLS